MRGLLYLRSSESIPAIRNDFQHLRTVFDSLWDRLSRETGRVCRAWHRTSEVQVLVPGIRGA